MYKDKYVVVIIVAGGKGKRMCEDRPKQYLKVDDKYILEKTIEQFEKNTRVDEIVLVINTDDIEFVKTKISCDKEKVSRVVYGGAERINSVYNGINSIENIADDDVVLIHDGVRPFVSQGLINSSIENAVEYGACVPVIELVDTLKEVDSENNIKKTLDRKIHKAVQTPQSFKYELIKECYDRAISDQLFVTDDSSIVEYYGYKVKTFKGIQKNIKITTQFDLKVAELISRMV